MTHGAPRVDLRRANGREVLAGTGEVWQEVTLAVDVVAVVIQARAAKGGPVVAGCVHKGDTREGDLAHLIALADHLVVRARLLGSVGDGDDVRVRLVLAVLGWSCARKRE